MRTPGVINPEEFDNEEDAIKAIDEAGRKQGWHPITAMKSAVEDILVKHGSTKTDSLRRTKRR